MVFDVSFEFTFFLRMFRKFAQDLRSPLTAALEKGQVQARSWPIDDRHKTLSFQLPLG